MSITTAFSVAADWPVEHIDDPEIQILDAWMAPPGQRDRDAGEEYRAGHIPGVVFFDIEVFSDHIPPLSHMMPCPEAFAVVMCELGVNQDKYLVIYGDGSLFSALHAWRMLRTLGIENVSIPAGGLAGWKRDELMFKEGDEDLPEGEFNVAFTPDAVVCVTDVLLASHEKTAQIVDAHPAACFNGEVDESRPSLKRGHVLGTLNVSWIELVRDGELRTTDELDAIFFSHGASFDHPIIASCSSGVTTVVVVLALATPGVTDVALYDGAWSEWGACSGLPAEPQL